MMVLFMDFDTGLLEMDNITKNISRKQNVCSLPNGRLFSTDLKAFYGSLTSIAYRTIVKLLRRLSC